MGDKRADVGLLVTELVAHAVLYGGIDDESFLPVGVSVTSNTIKGELEYPGEPFTADAEPEGHFGLYIVESLSDSWGFARMTLTRNRDQPA